MPSKVCHYFRSKNAYLPGNTGNLALDMSSTGCYWCLRTMSNAGPDEHFTAPEECVPERHCYLESPKL